MSIGRFFGWTISRSALLVIGAAVAGGGYFGGYMAGASDGYRDGCRVGLDASLCAYAEDIRAKLNHIPGVDIPGKPNPQMVAERQTLCAEMRLRVPDSVAVHYGCP